MKKRDIINLAVLVIVPVGLWLLTIVLFATVTKERSFESVGRIGNWSTYMVKNYTQFKTALREEDLSFLPVSTLKAINSYALQFPISFFITVNGESTIKIESLLSEIRDLPDVIVWSEPRDLDGDVYFTSEGTTPSGAKAIFAKFSLVDKPGLSSDMIVIQELVRYEAEFWQFAWMALAFYGGIFFIIGLINKRTTGNLVSEITLLNKSVQKLQEGGESTLLHDLEASHFEEIRNLSLAIKSYAETNEVLINKLQDASSTLVDHAREMTSIGESQSSSLMDYAERIMTVTASSEQIEASNNAIQNLASSIRDKTGESVEKFADVDKMLEHMVAGMSKITERTTSYQKQLNENIQKIQNVHAVTDLMTTINEELTLISFNAQIESITGKNQAQRFSVVAREIRELSRNVEKSIRDIKRQVQEVIDSSNETVQQFRDVHHLVTENMDLLKKIERMMDQFSNHSNRNAESVYVITEAIEEQRQALKSIVESMNTMNSQTSQISQQVEQLKTRSYQLNENGNEFQLLVSEQKVRKTTNGFRV